MSYAGLDIGTAFSKAVIIEGNTLLAYHITPSGGNYKLTAEEVMQNALAKAGASFQNVTYIVATGQGASTVAFSNERATEISSISRGIHYLFPSVRTIIDIGGQASRAIKVDENGRPLAFVLSEKCAAGSGKFLEIIARVLQLHLEDIGPLSLKSTKNINFTTGCAVFAESEAISRITEGASREDILAGIHNALAAKVLNLVERVGVQKDWAVTGGGAKNIGVVRSIERKVGFSMLIPEEPQITVAFGAALLAREKASQGIIAPQTR